MEPLVFAFILLAFMMLGMAADGADPPTPTPTPTGFPPIIKETQAPIAKPISRLAGLAEIAGATIPVIESSCNVQKETILGCFDSETNTIIVTQNGMSKDDSKIICVIKHEMRHKWQSDQGLIKYDQYGNITNTEWIEKDARENGCP